MAGMSQTWKAWSGIGFGLGVGLAMALRPRPEWSLRGHVALITGGSRGLGLLLGRELAREGCQLAICARDEAELARARTDLEARGATVHTGRCDVADRRDVERFVADVITRFGGIDLLVNNAGIIKVGPLETMTVGDFEEAMRVNFWGAVYPVLGVLPVMRAQGGGRIVNVTSIGGVVSVPHLVPYTCAKAAAVAFSHGLRAELAGEGVTVVTVVPGLMRTGSYLNASFKGNSEAESVWFALGSTLPGLSMDAERAARQIVRAAKRGDAEAILSLPAWLLARVHALFPGTTADILALVNQLLPQPKADGGGVVSGHEAIARTQSGLLHVLTQLGRSAAERFGQHPGPRLGGGLRPPSDAQRLRASGS